MLIKMSLSKILIHYFLPSALFVTIEMLGVDTQLTEKNVVDVGSISKFINTLINENLENHACFSFVLQSHYNSELNNDNICACDTIDNQELLLNAIDIPNSVMYLEFSEQSFASDLIIMEQNFEIGCDWYLVHACSPEKFMVLLKQVIKKANHRESPRLLFLIDGNHYSASKYQFLFQQALDISFETTIISLAYSETDIIVEFKMGDLRTGESKTIGSCYLRDCDSSHSKLFLNNLSQFNGREIRFSAFNYNPYFIIKPRWDGTEFRILSEFSKKFNCTLQLVTDENQWGAIFKNESGNGVLGLVYEGKAEVGFSALYLWYNEYQYLDYSVSYIRTGITCLVPRPLLISPWLLPIQPFDNALWTVVVITLVTSTVALYYVAKISNKFSSNWRRRFRTVDDSVLRVVGMLVLQVPTAKGIRPPPTALRYVITWLEIMFLLVVTSYHSGLASVLTLHRHESAIETIEDLVNSGLSWGATHDAWIFSILLSTEPKTKLLVRRFNVLDEKGLNKHTQTRDFAFSLERLPGGYFAVGDYITEESINHLQLMREDIYYEYCVYALPKGSPYKRDLDKLILNIQSAGLVSHWEGEVVRKYLRMNVQLGVSQSNAAPTESEPIVLEVKHIYGALTILIMGLSSATVIFLIEIFWMREKLKLKKVRISSKF